ncbi:uncharacterized protein EbC_pEb10200140 (plasmid) [Erwinia billingiae Eb661]|uniref:Uncharacterized protein n=1 Tax=Erwinia billingiae (strain Eb661) TaxID=634500 RepID=D8MJA4_ERWBE|nr:hypothetical protein [Erwinia billingiae]CAX53292.1 uncharacterized protein EbC_pEb10200140 [Erwinia billingiae Eb661]
MKEMITALHSLLDEGAQMLTSWMPKELGTLLDNGSQLITSWFEGNQLTEPMSVIVIAGLFITGLFMIGTMLESLTSSPKK